MQNKKNKKKTMPKSVIFLILILFGVGIILTVYSKTSTSNTQSAGSNNSSGSKVIASGENLVIPINEISGKVKFYPIKVDGTEMEVMAVKAPDGTIRTAFNTCQVCYSSGKGYYKQQDNVLVCQNCGNQFPMSHVEVAAGGCNPWPIFAEDKTVTDESITISYDFLKESKLIFANWR